MGAMGMPFQQMLTENSQVILTEIEEKKHWENPDKGVWVRIKDTKCLFLAS